MDRKQTFSKTSRENKKKKSASSRISRGGEGKIKKFNTEEIVSKNKRATSIATNRRFELFGLAFDLIAFIGILGIFGVNVGFVGLGLASILTDLFGAGALLFASALFFIGLYLITEHKNFKLNARFFGFFLMFTFLLTLYHYIKIPEGAEILPESISVGGGLFGGSVLLILKGFFGETGSGIVIVAALIASILLITNWSLGKGIVQTTDKAKKGFGAGLLAFLSLKKSVKENKKIENPDRKENIEMPNLYNQEWDVDYLLQKSAIKQPEEIEETIEMPKTHIQTFWQDKEADANVASRRAKTVASRSLPALAHPVRRSNVCTSASCASADANVASRSSVCTSASCASAEVKEEEKEGKEEEVKVLYPAENYNENVNINLVSEPSRLCDEAPKIISPSERKDTGMGENGFKVQTDAFRSREIPSFPMLSADANVASRSPTRGLASRRSVCTSASCTSADANVASRSSVCTSASCASADSQNDILQIQPSNNSLEADFDLSTPDFEEPNLGETDFGETDFGETDFGETDNIGDNFIEENIHSSDIQDAPVSKENIENTDLTKPYELPTVTHILSKKVKKENLALRIEIEDNAKTLSKTLADFKVNANIKNACHGPAVTRYELEPAPGVKVSKITGLAEDIALALAATSVRIEPIPGKSAIGIEVPNKELEGVQLREVLEEPYFMKAESRLTVGLGKDIGGQAIFADLAKMPHLLIAGSTGSGKSVCVNTLITSILFKAKPDEVKFILIDPKMVELSNYNGIPHLMVPVVTDAKKAASVLNWAVQEMEKRYAKFAQKLVRNMETYNAKYPEDKMGSIVIIIDELADLMMVAPHDVEDAICRLAQKARAAGIHLVLATQRPSVDVITGIIKANIPSRIAFAVSSQIDSRTILDSSGAEKLLGKGDMLFYPIGMPKPRRVQGAFVSDEEVELLLDFIKSQGQEMEVNEEIESFTENDVLSDDKGKSKKDDVPKKDELLNDAVELVLSTGQASASNIQRRFRVGYARAGRLIDTMEILGIVGPSSGSKPRDILMSAEEALKIVENL